MASVLMYILSVFHIWFVISTALKLGEENVCEITNGDGKPYITCCAGYIYWQEQHKCRDCPNGRYGVNCNLTCLPNYYGIRCKFPCNCTNTEKCNPTTGQCEDIMSGEQDSTGTAGKYWLFIGVPCIILVIARTVIASIAIRNLKARRMTNAEIPMHEIQITRSTTDTGNIYDELDETMMNAVHILQPADNQHNVQNLERTDSYSGESTDTFTDGASDGYLNPYTPLAEDWQKNTHVYNDGDVLSEDKNNDGYLHS